MRLDEIRECAGRIPKVGPLTVALRHDFDDGLSVDIARMARHDIPALLTIAEAAVKLRDLRGAEPRMVHWDAYTKWQADVADAVTAVENAVDAFEGDAG